MTLQRYWELLDAQGKHAFAARAGTSYTYLRHLEKRRRRPSPQMVQRLVDASDGLIPGDTLR